MAQGGAPEPQIDMRPEPELSGLRQSYSTLDASNRPRASRTTSTSSFFSSTARQKSRKAAVVPGSWRNAPKIGKSCDATGGGAVTVGQVGFGEIKGAGRSVAVSP